MTLPSVLDASAGKITLELFILQMHFHNLCSVNSKNREVVQFDLMRTSHYSDAPSQSRVLSPTEMFFGEKYGIYEEVTHSRPGHGRHGELWSVWFW